MLGTSIICRRLGVVCSKPAIASQYSSAAGATEQWNRPLFFLFFEGSGTGHLGLASRNRRAASPPEARGARRAGLFCRTEKYCFG